MKMEDSFKIQKLWCIFIIPLFLFLYPTISFAFDNDSSSILKHLSDKINKIRSGKIFYSRPYKSFFKSNESPAFFELAYTQLQNDSENFTIWLKGLISKSWHYEVIYYQDTLYELDNNKKEILFQYSEPVSFLDDYGSGLFQLSFGVYPKKIENILSSPGYFAVTDTVIDGDPCSLFSNFTAHNSKEIDSTLKQWVISENDCSHNSYKEISWGFGGNMLSVSHQVKDCSYSESVDTSLATKIKERIFTLIHDSGYVRKAYYHSTIKSSTDQSKFVKEGSLFPIRHFQSFSDEDINIEQPHIKLTLLDFTYMACDPCRESIPSVSSLYAKYKDSGVAIYAVDPYDKNEKEIFAKYIKKYRLDYPILFSDKKTVLDSLGIESFPTFIILDNTMKIRYLSAGSGMFREEILGMKIEELLKEYAGDHLKD